MFAIINGDKTEWYNASRGWTPASNEATIYDYRVQAEEVINAERLGRSAEVIRADKGDEDEEDEDISIAGCIIQHDASGVGHAWKVIPCEEIPADIAMEIEGEIFDGGKESCSYFIGSNGEHYRW